MSLLEDIHREATERKRRLGIRSAPQVTVLPRPVKQPPPPPPVATIGRLSGSDWEFLCRRAEAICRMFHPNEPQRRPAVTPSIIIDVVATFYGLRALDMMSHRRTQSVIRPRQIAMYLCKVLTTASYPTIGKFMGRRDHTTCLHAWRKIECLRHEDDRLADEIQLIVMKLAERFALPDDVEVVA